MTLGKKKKKLHRAGPRTDLSGPTRTDPLTDMSPNWQRGTFSFKVTNKLTHTVRFLIELSLITDHMTWRNPIVSTQFLLSKNPVISSEEGRLVEQDLIFTKLHVALWSIEVLRGLHSSRGTRIPSNNVKLNTEIKRSPGREQKDPSSSREQENLPEGKRDSPTLNLYFAVCLSPRKGRAMSDPNCH